MPPPKIKYAIHLASIGFLTFGLWGLISPSTMMAFIGLNELSPGALVEFRAYYGGLEIGFAAFLQFSARRPSYARPALLGANCIFAGCALVRLLAMIYEGVAGPALVASLLGETTLAFTSFLALRDSDLN